MSDAWAEMPEIYLVAMDDNGVVRAADLRSKEGIQYGATAGGTNALQYTISNILKTGSVLFSIAIPMNRSRPFIPVTAYSGMWRRCLNVRFTGAVKRCTRFTISEEA